MEADSETLDLETRLLLEAIYAKYGYDLRGHTLQSMRRRLDGLRIKSGAAHLGELQHRLLVEPAFFASVRDALTIQESEMFRDPEFFRAFREQVVPLLRTYPHLKIWHAGCAGGEEVYSVAVLLEEEGLYERAQLYATDLSTGAIARTREAVYPESKLALFAHNYELAGGKTRLVDHLTCAYGRIAIKESLRRNVVCFSHDLASDHGPGEMQVVFCRNVLIYFAPALRDRAVGVLTKSVARGGFLCLGASERLGREHLRSGLELFDARAGAQPATPGFTSTYRMGIAP